MLTNIEEILTKLKRKPEDPDSVDEFIKDLERFMADSRTKDPILANLFNFCDQMQFDKYERFLYVSFALYISKMTDYLVLLETDNSLKIPINEQN